MIPFGPWLALGFIMALWWHTPIREVVGRYLGHIVATWKEAPQFVLMAAGVLLVGSVAALTIVTRLFHPKHAESTEE